MPSSAATRRANKQSRQATADDLAATIPPTRVVRDKIFSVSIKAASDTSDDERDQIWRIFKENMYELYHSSSFGWKPEQKRAEMFDPLSRFVIARNGADPSACPPRSGVIAYSIFRFEREDRQNVIYCYELQVSQDARRLGLGEMLTQMLFDVGAQWGMAKVMLTVFKANRAAMQFYESIGFATDETSPDVCGDTEGGAEDEHDYAILSRRIARRT